MKANAIGRPSCNKWSFILPFGVVMPLSGVSDLILLIRYVDVQPLKDRLFTCFSVQNLRSFQSQQIYLMFIVCLAGHTNIPGLLDLDPEREWRYVI